jgi:acyl carrier protein
MQCCHRNEVDRKLLLAKLSEELKMSPAQIEATSAWRQFSGTGDSLDLVELMMEIEDELAAEDDGKPPPIEG